MHVVRGLRKDCSQIIFREKKDSDSNKIDDGDIYNILKLLPIAKKVGCIEKFKGQDDNQADLLFAAIGSDLCAEFTTYASVLFRTGWKLPKYLNEMKGWKAIHDYNFSELIKNKNSFILKKFLIMIKSVHKVVGESVNTIFKVFGCCSCLPIPYIIVLNLCTNVTKKIEQSISAFSGAADNVESLVNKKFAKLN